jgi:membrane protein implicated in regulation of membrane protease activity
VAYVTPCRAMTPERKAEKTMTQSADRPKSPVAAHPITSAAIAILVIATISFTVYVPIYARITPKVGDFPFFYFYLLIFMPITSVALWIVVQLQKRLGTPSSEEQS